MPGIASEMPAIAPSPQAYGGRGLSTRSSEAGTPFELMLDSGPGASETSPPPRPDSTNPPQQARSTRDDDPPAPDQRPVDPSSRPAAPTSSQKDANSGNPSADGPKDEDIDVATAHTDKDTTETDQQKVDTIEVGLVVPSTDLLQTADVQQSSGAIQTAVVPVVAHAVIISPSPLTFNAEESAGLSSVEASPSSGKASLSSGEASLSSVEESPSSADAQASPPGIKVATPPSLSLPDQIESPLVSRSTSPEKSGITEHANKLPPMDLNIVDTDVKANSEGTDSTPTPAITPAAIPAKQKELAILGGQQISVEPSPVSGRKTESGDDAQAVKVISSDTSPTAAGQKNEQTSEKRNEPISVTELSHALDQRAAAIHSDLTSQPAHNVGLIDQPAPAEFIGQPVFNVGLSSLQAPISGHDIRPMNEVPVVPIAGLAVEIASRALYEKNRFEIRLDPPELGRVDIRLDVDRQGNVTSRLIVERAETLEILRREAPQLERAFEQAGLKTNDNSLQFSLRNQSSGWMGQNNDNEFASNAARLVVPDDEMAIIEAVRGYNRWLGRSGGVDISV